MRMPPSPLLSARMMRTTYFSVTTTISAQKISDSRPSTLPSFRGIAWWPPKTSRTVYSGEVPMSP